MSLNTVSVRLTLEFGPTNVVRTAHRLGITSKLEPNASIALGTSEVSVLELVSAYVPVRQWRQRDHRPTSSSGCGRSAARRSMRARARRSGGCIDPRYVAMMNTMMRETIASGTGAQGRPAGLAGRRQDRHQPGFPRRLVHRLHEPARHRRVVRQRQFLADPPRDRRRVAGRGLEPVHEGGAPGRAGLAPAGRHRRVREPRGAVGPIASGRSASCRFASRWNPPAPLPPAGVPQGTPMSSHAPTAPQPAGAPARPRDGVRPSEGTIDGWLMNRLFPGR